MKRWEKCPGWGDLGDIQDMALIGEWGKAGWVHPGWILQTSLGVSL